MTKPIATPIATARYNRYVVVEFDKGADAQEFFYQLGEQMGHEPRKGKGHQPPGTGLEWALRQLGPKRLKQAAASGRAQPARGAAKKVR
jgi:hypothetical protein